MALYIYTNYAPNKIATYDNHKINNIQKTSDKSTLDFELNKIQPDLSNQGSVRSFDSQIRDDDISLRNANDAISMVQIANQSVANIIEITEQMKKAILQHDDHQKIQELQKNILEIINQTEFNGNHLLKHDAFTSNQNAQLNFEIGFGGNQNYPFHFVNANLDSYLGIITQDNFEYQDTDFKTSAVNNALHYLNEQSSRYDAIQNRFEGMMNYAQQPNQHKTKVLNIDSAKNQVEQVRSKLLEQLNLNIVIPQSSENVLTLIS